MCSHIASIIWYLAKSRHEGETRGVRNWVEHVLDVADIPPSANEFDSDDSSCASVCEEWSAYWLILAHEIYIYMLIKIVNLQ